MCSFMLTQASTTAMGSGMPPGRCRRSVGDFGSRVMVGTVREEGCERFYQVMAGVNASRDHPAEIGVRGTLKAWV
ncbi:hypothetical protein SPBR_04488 [Sporothrix brasiliensis 5110]|uniref:Uncharacterized protein n=1 Tax=Sporothrix brasiliensis 5110 TaxID=1398154 RepID=A0A0C2FQL1_9PEZI|nr:uncharacterized protein SPBR_04488 [Sporothrix brasiliensis 5110]KIH93338.1 hypothetical protein SPBR_04488 [Sporothrix brasiliensis 5110]